MSCRSSPCIALMVAAAVPFVSPKSNAVQQVVLTPQTGHVGSIDCLAFDNSERLLASGGHDGTCKVWDVSASIERFSLALSAGPVIAASFHPSQPLIACLAFGNPSRLVVADYVSGLSMWSTEADFIGRSVFLGFVAQGRLLALGLPHAIRIWDTKTWADVANVEIEFDDDGSFVCCALSPDETRLACLRESGLLEVRSSTTGVTLSTQRLARGEPKNLAWTQAGIRGVWFDDSSETPRAQVRCLDDDPKVYEIECPGPMIAAAIGEQAQFAATFSEALESVHVWTGRSHRSYVVPESYVLAFSGRGRWLAAAHGTGEISLVDLQAPNSSRPRQASAQTVSQLMFSADGTILCTVSDARSGPVDVSIWDGTTGLQRSSISSGKSRVDALAVTSDGSAVALTDSVSTEIHETRTGHRLRELPSLSSACIGIALPSAEGELLEADLDATLFSFAPKSAAEPTVRIRAGGSMNACFSPNGKHFARAQQDSTVGVYDTASGRLEATVMLPMISFPALALADDKSTLVALGAVTLDLARPSGSYVVAIDIASGRTLLERQVDAPTAHVLAFDALHRTIAVGTATGPPSRVPHPVPDSTDNARVIAYSLGDSTMHSFAGHRGGVTALAFRPTDGLLVSGGADGIVRSWIVRPEQAQHELVLQETYEPVARRLERRARWVTAAAIGPDARQLVAACGNQLRAWNLAPGSTAPPDMHRVLLEADVPATCATFSPDGKWLATGTHDGTVQLWNAADYTRTATIELVHAGVSFSEYEPTYRSLNLGCVRFSPDSRHLAATSRSTLVVMSSDSGARVAEKTLTSTLEPVCIWDRDGASIITGRQGEVILVPLDDRPIRLIAHYETALMGLALSPDGNNLWFSDGSGVSRVDLRSGATQRHVETTNGPMGPLIVKSNEGDLCVANLMGGLRVCRAHARGTAISVAPIGDATLLNEHAAAIISLDQTPDGKYLVTGSLDGRVILWKSATDEPLASFVAVGNADYAVLSHDGFYSGSRGGVRGITARIGQEVVPAAALDWALNRPDEVYRSIGVADVDALLALGQLRTQRLKLLHLPSGDLPNLKSLPTVSQLGPVLPPSTDELGITLQLSAKAKASTLTRLLILVNGVPVPDRGGVALTGSDWFGSTRIQLGPGRNVVRISVDDERGRRSLPQGFEILRTSVGVRPSFRLLSVGISNYDPPIKPLPFAACDAAAIARHFTQNCASYREPKVSLLPEEQATREAILTHTSELFRGTAPEDTVVLFLAGHGKLRDGQFHFLTRGADPVTLEGTLTSEDIDALMDGIPARNRLVLIDACNVGESDVHGLRFGNLPLLEELFADLSDTGVTILGAATAWEIARESTGSGHGVFTTALLEGLDARLADTNHDGRVLLSELRNYVVSRVPALSRQQQHPVARREQLEVDFELP